MHMQSRSVDLDLPRARGALPRDPGLPYALALPVGVACRGCVCVWLRVWHFQRTTRAQTYLTNQSVHRTVRLTPNLHDTTLDDDGARQVEIFRPKMGQIAGFRLKNPLTHPKNA